MSERYSVRKLDNGWGIEMAGEIRWTEGPLPKGLALRLCSYLNNEHAARLALEQQLQEVRQLNEVLADGYVRQATALRSMAAILNVEVGGGPRDTGVSSYDLPERLLAALEQERRRAEEMDEALVLAVRHGRSGMYPVNPHIRRALHVVDPEHFPDTSEAKGDTNG